jgi:hypothetical protein
VTTRTAYCLNSCRGLVSITFETGSQHSEIPARGFESSLQLREMTVAPSVRFLGSSALAIRVQISAFRFESDSAVGLSQLGGVASSGKSKRLRFWIVQPLVRFRIRSNLFVA